MSATCQKNQVVKRWSAKRKAEVVLRLFRGESIDDVSRAIGVPAYLVNEWKEEAIFNLEEGFKLRATDPRDVLLSRAKEQIGELSMENELLKRRVEKKGPFALRRSKQ